jgi:NAD(P)H-flavin reductase
MSIAPETSATVHACDPWRTASVTIRRVRNETPSVFSYDLAFDDAEIAESYRFLPGQFNMLYVPGVGEAAISIADQASNSGTLQHTVRSTGAVTRAIELGGKGMSLGLRGPFGTNWPLPLMTDPAAKRDVVIAAGGIGLAPLRSLVSHVARQRSLFGSVALIVGARSPADLLYFDDYDDWQAASIDVQFTVDRPSPGWKGNVGVVTLLLERLSLPKPQSTLVMTCGPEVMMRYVAKAATGRGIPDQNIWVTLERNMNCAIGLCGHCQLGPTFLCKDGPVFRFDRVREWLRVQDF